MLKIKILTAVTACLTLASCFTVAEASIKPSTMKKEVKSYEAVMKKNSKVLSDGNMFKTLKKGQKVTVVKKVDLQGYDYLVLKGHYYLPVDDDSIKIIKSLPGKIDYDRFDSKYYDPFISRNIEWADKKSKYYRGYRNYLEEYKKVFHDFLLDFRPGNVNQAFYNVQPSYYGSGGPDPYDFQGWVENGQPSVVRHRYFICPKYENKIDITSKSFVNHYFYTNDRSVMGIRPGSNIKNVGFEVCGFLGTDAGYVWKVGDFGYVQKYPERGIKTGPIKEVVITPSQKISYQKAIKTYGKPTSVKTKTKNRVEYIMTYNHNPNNGYKIEVALDGKNGYVKYMRKIND